MVEEGGKEEIRYDIFRFNESGKITNQWTVAQARLPFSEAANPHPHF